MNFNCQKEDLLYGVQIIGKAISTKNTLPILNGLLIEAKENMLTLRATDLDIAIECAISADVVEEGSVVIADGKRFIDIVRSLPNNNVNISLINDSDININYGFSSINVRGFEADQFPQLPAMDNEVEGTMAGEVFARMVKQVGIAASNDDIQPILTGIMLDIKGDALNMVTTDFHRLALSEGVWNFGKDNELKVIVPAKTMIDVANIAAGEEEVLINISKNNACFKMGNTVFFARLISGQFPDYRPIIPKAGSFKHEAYINKKDFGASLKRASLLSRDDNNTVKLELKEGEIVLTASTGDIGNIRELIPATLAGEELLVGYNLKYILDFLKVSDSENIFLKLTGNLTPGVISEEDNEKFTYVILPLRLNN